MKSKMFSYRPGIKLGPFDDSLMLSAGFDKKDLLKHIKVLLAEHNFNIDESSVSFEIRENELYVEGLAFETGERKSIGFMAEQ